MAELAKINDLLRQPTARDITMVSLSVDPVTCAAAQLKQYFEVFGSKPGWLLDHQAEVQYHLIAPAEHH